MTIHRDGIAEQEAWVHEQLKKRNESIVGPFEKIKETDLTVIQKIPATNGIYYLKINRTVSKFEIPLTEHLFTSYPKKIVNTVATHPTNNFILMKEIGGTPLRQIKEKNLWKKALQEYSELQVQETKHVEKLLNIGVPDRRLQSLKDGMQQYMKELCLTGLSEKETLEVLGIQSELIDLCNEMEGMVPYSIEHGDLHSGNIHIVDGNPIFFDWGDATVSHPFFSTRVFWHALDELSTSQQEWLQIIDEFRPYYLEPWTAYAPMSQLEKLLTISDQLACIHKSLLWHLYINPYRENKQETAKRPAQWLQVLLEHKELIK